MAEEGLRASWQRTERHLRDALAQQPLPDDVRVAALEFIDHNELGVAFEWIAAGLVEAGTGLDPSARDALAAAAHEMGLEDNADWLRLSR